MLNYSHPTHRNVREKGRRKEKREGGSKQLLSISTQFVLLSVWSVGHLHIWDVD